MKQGRSDKSSKGFVATGLSIIHRVSTPSFFLFLSSETQKSLEQRPTFLTRVFLAFTSFFSPFLLFRVRITNRSKDTFSSLSSRTQNEKAFLFSFFRRPPPFCAHLICSFSSGFFETQIVFEKRKLN